MNGRGFTTGELLVALCIASLLALATLPSFRHIRDDLHLQTVQADLHSALLLARQQAITAGRPVVVRSINSDWNNGWQVFVDTDNNTRPGAGETILLEHQSLPRSIRLTSNFGHYARYRPNGRTSYASGAFMAGTWLLCSTSEAGQGRKLVMSYGGRVRRSTRVQTACIP